MGFLQYATLIFDKSAHSYINIPNISYGNLAYIYSPGQKYKTTLKNEGKDILYNFYIMKIRYMKDRV